MAPQAPPASIGYASTERSTKDRNSWAVRDPYYPEAENATLVGESPAMQRIFSVIGRIAPTDSSVLITGATGTGKEL